MDKRLKLFWSELVEQCEMNQNFVFIFQVEYWSHVWMPWDIYLDDKLYKPLKFSANDISEDDLQTLVCLGLIEFIADVPTTDTLVMCAKKYKIKNK